jgi:serine/threonine protein phosphatase PrpC
MTDAQEASKFLVDYALKKGSQDNVTAIVVRFLPVPEGVTHEEESGPEDELLS